MLNVYSLDLKTYRHCAPNVLSNNKSLVQHNIKFLMFLEFE